MHRCDRICCCTNCHDLCQACELLPGRCPDIGSQSRLQLAKLLFEKGKELEGTPMLFELATALPDLLAAASRAAVEASTLSRQARAQPQNAGDNLIREQDHLLAPQPKQRQRQRPMQHHQVVDVARESAMLQVRNLLNSSRVSKMGLCHICMISVCVDHFSMLHPGFYSATGCSRPGHDCRACRSAGKHGRTAVLRRACARRVQGSRPQSGGRPFCRRCSRARWLSYRAPPAAGSPHRCRSIFWNRQALRTSSPACGC